MAFILDIPVLFKVLGSLLLILALNGFFRQLIAALLIGTIALAFWTGHPIASVGEIAWDRFASINNIFLMLIVIQIMALSSQMAATGVMRELVGVVQSRISRRGAFAALPALIGFLPMPGGALFSAPLVSDCDPNGELEPVLKTKVNYWFRHVWEYWWPLYPGVLLAIEITGLTTWRFMLIQLPLSLFAIGTGYFFLLRKIKTDLKLDKTCSTEKKQPFLPLISPILVIIATYLLIKVIFPTVSNTSRYLPMAIGILLAILFLQTRRPLNLEKWRKILLSKRVFMMIALVAMVRIYGAFIEAKLPSGVPLVEEMRHELAQFHIPEILVLMIVPFICGLTTGLAIGFVGASFPIVISMLGANPEPAILLSSTALAYGFGYMGMILSPVHICLVASNEHFKTRLTLSLRRLLFPAATMLVLNSIYFLALRYLL